MYRNVHVSLGLLILIELFFFHSHIARNIENFYPIGQDQSNYLALTYLIFENIKKYGMLRGIEMSPSLPTGILFPYQAVLLYLIFGASRFTALLVNFIYFIALQITTYVTVKDVEKNSTPAILFLGLILLVQVPYLNLGNLFDFRIDFMVFCLYGIFLNCIVRSNFLLDKRWSLISSLVMGVTILTRSLTIIYFVGIIFIFLTYLFLRAFFCYQDNLYKNKVMSRISNSLLSCFIVFIISAPWIWINRLSLYNYYVVGHVIGEERYIRQMVSGIKGLIANISYYPDALFFLQIGYIGLAFLAIIIGFVFLYQFIKYFVNYELSSNFNNEQDWETGFVFLTISILIPLLILSLDPSKSYVVASIMVMPFLWIFVWYLLYINSKSNYLLLKNWFLKILIVCCLLSGLAHSLFELARTKEDSHLKNLANLTQMYLDIGNYAIANNWSQIHLGIDRIHDFLAYTGIKDVYYEKRGKLLNIDNTLLGSRIFSIKENEVITGMHTSNVIIMNVNNYRDIPVYPFDESIIKHRSKIKGYAEKNMYVLGDYPYLGEIYRVYVTH